MQMLAKLNMPTRSTHRLRSAALAGAALAALLIASVAMGAPPVSVMNARIRLLPGDLPLAGYFDLVNRGNQPLTLTGASSPAFGMVHLHRSMEENGRSTMTAVEGIEIKPGATLHVAPGGYHLMLMQRVRPLRVGDNVSITLKFSAGESLPVVFVVKSAETE
jgi:periplasmic copper chaperone A